MESVIGLGDKLAAKQAVVLDLRGGVPGKPVDESQYKKLTSSPS